MNPPDLQFWGRIMGVLALEVAVLVGGVLLIGRWIRAATVRRTIWQATLVLLGILVVGELFGLRETVRSLGSRASADGASKRRWVARVSALPSSAGDPVDVMPEIPSTVPADASVSRRAVWWPGWLWVTGAALVGLRAGGVRLWLLGQRSFRTGRDPSSQAMIQRLAPLLGLRGVALSVWPSLRGPVAFGILRPTVAVPADFSERFGVVQREVMLAHELAHLAGRDPVWLAVSDVVCALLWWHPGAWWARRQLRAAGEQVADGASSLVPQGTTALAESLVALGREFSGASPVHGLGVAGGGFRSELGRRVELLLRGTPSWKPTQFRDRLGGWILGSLGWAAWMAVPLGEPQQGSPWNLVQGVTRAGQTEVEIAKGAPSKPTGLVKSGMIRSYDSTAPIEEPGPITAGLAFDLPSGNPGVKRVYVPLRDPFPDEPALGMSSAFLAPTARVIGFQSPLDASLPLLTRTFRLNSAHFLAAVRATEGVMATTNVQAQVRDVFRLCGLEFPPIPTNRPSEMQSLPAIFFNDRTGTLFVRADTAAQEAIERVVEVMNYGGGEEASSAPQITLTTYFTEITAGGVEDLGLDWVFGVSPTNNPSMESVALTPTRGRVQTLRSDGQMTLLSADQFAALRRRLEGRGGVDFLSAPKVTTVSGREARLQVADMRTIVTGVNARVDKATDAVGFDGVLVSPTNSPAIEYKVEQMYFGPELEILPIAEGEHWQLGLTARMTEFLGYEDPGSDQPAIRVPGAKPLTAQRPLPLVRRRELTANTRVRSGEVVALRGPMVENLTIRKGGVFRRGSTNVLHKRLYVFVVPQSDPPEQAGALTPARTAQPVIVRALSEPGRFLVGSRAVQEFELSGVLRSLALTRPDLVLLIRKDSGSPESNLQLAQEVSAKAGIRYVTLP